TFLSKFAAAVVATVSGTTVARPLAQRLTRDRLLTSGARAESLERQDIQDWRGEVRASIRQVTVCADNR
ncbi:MAG TPA: hypothetical protein VF774_09275, partial [Pseudoduganella sp.]